MGQDQPLLARHAVAPTGGFAAGIRVLTPDGYRMVEALRPGDRLIGRDAGLVLVRRIHRLRLTVADLAARPWLAPIRIRPGSFGRGQPQRALFLGGGHGLLLQGEQFRRLVGEAEVLASVGALADGVTIRPEMGKTVHYVLIEAERHEIVYAEGIAVETTPMPLASARPRLSLAQTRALVARSVVAA